MAYVYSLELELKSEDVAIEFVQLAKRMLNYNREHFNHSFDILIPEAKRDRVLVVHWFKDLAEYEKLDEKQGADPTYGVMQKELKLLLNDFKGTLYSTL